MEKKFPFFKTLTLLVWLVLGMGTAFAMDSWLQHRSKTAPNTEGTGANQCYLISTPEELAWFAQHVNDQGENAKSCAKLVADLDLAGNFWVPISFKGRKHAVHLDGNGFIIRNLYISAEELLNKYPNDTQAAQNLGLIGAFTGHVQNIILENVEVYGYGRNYATGGKDPVQNPLSIGTVVGWQSNSNSIVENCYVTGKMITSGDGQAVGGIVGNNGGGTIRNCYSAVNIDASGTSYVGGIAGYTKNFDGNVTISSCVYNGESLSISGAGEAGAVVGNHLNGSTTFDDVYYDNTKFENGVGASMGGEITGTTSGTADLNSELIASTLNEGNENAPWSSGETDICLNGYGADGHKITFSANGGSFAEGTTFVKFVQHGNIINNDGVADPVWKNDDHVFAGWSGDAYMAPASKAVTISAVWNPVYTITFDAAPGTFPNEASGVVKTVKVEEGKKIAVKDFVVPSYYTNQGVKYSFMGWSTTENPAEEDALVDENGLDNLPNATGNITLHAVWTEATIYTVTFDANGHGPSIANYVKVKNVYDQEKATALTDDDFEHADGYSLDTENGSGWCIDSECSAEFNFNTPIAENKTLYAKWKAKEYTINYENLNGASNSNPSKYTVDGIDLADPSWDAAHRFLGWYKDPEFKNKVTSIPAGSTGNLTLYAEWEDVTYTITYRGGTYGIGLVPSETKVHGQPYTLRDVSYTRKGYVQTGWSKTDGGTDVIALGSSYLENANLILYPTWEIATYTINYVCEVCTESNPSKPRTYTVNDTKDDNLSIYSPTFSSSEYEFKGWYWDKNYTNRTTNIPKGALGDTTLYGKMLKKYTISYELNGGTKHNSRTSYTSETATFALGQATGREGYTFAGWYDNPTFAGNPVTEIPLGSTGDKIFYAKWIQEYGAITIVSNIDGTNSAVINGDYSHKNKPNEQRDAVAIPNDIVVNNVVMSRKFPVNVYSTIVLPFSVNTENVEGLSAVLYYNGIKKENGKSTIRMKVLWAEDNLIMGKNGQYVHYNHTNMLANTPYLLMMKDETFAIKSEAYPITLERTTPAEEDANGSGWTFRGTWKYKEWGPKQEDSPGNYDSETGYAYGFSAAASGDKINVGDFVRVGEGAWIRPMRAYLVRDDKKAQLARANGAYVKRPSVVQEELPEIMSIVIDNGRDDEGQTTVIGHFNTRTGEIKMIPQNRTFDIKGRNVGNKANKARGAYYGKKVLKK